MGNHRKVLGREECLKDYISGCIENVLNVLGWGQGMKQGDQLESFYQPKGETKMVCISSLRAEPFVFLSPLLLAPRTHWGTQKTFVELKTNSSGDGGKVEASRIFFEEEPAGLADECGVQGKGRNQGYY